MSERLQRDSDQSYFWSDEWQARIQEAEVDIQAGRTVQVTGENIEQALEWLDGGYTTSEGGCHAHR